MREFYRDDHLSYLNYVVPFLYEDYMRQGRAKAKWKRRWLSKERTNMSQPLRQPPSLVAYFQAINDTQLPVQIHTNTAFH